MAASVALAEAPDWQELDGKVLRLEDRVQAEALAWREVGLGRRAQIH